MGVWLSRLMDWLISPVVCARTMYPCSLSMPGKELMLTSSESGRWLTLNRARMPVPPVPPV